MAINWSDKLAAHLNLNAATTSEFGDLLAQIGRGVQSAIELEISRHLEPADHVEAYNGRGLDNLWLRWDPIISLASVKVCDVELTFADDTDVPVYPPPQVVVESGAMLQRTDGLTFPDAPASTVISYKAGYRTPPPALLQMGILWGALIFKNRDRAGIASQSMGTQTTTFTDDVPQFVRRGLVGWARVTARS